MNTYSTTATIHVFHPDHPLYKTPINGIQAKILIVKHADNDWDAYAVEPGGFAGVGTSLDSCLLNWEEMLKLVVADVLIDAKELSKEPLYLFLRDCWKNVNRTEIDRWWQAEPISAPVKICSSAVAGNS